jgi:signal recognition particle receptor subunit beta
VAVLDVAHKTITLKVVYYGCALGGKTTNLQTLHKLTDPDGAHGLLSIATKDDRTLFFDLLPMELGQVGGLNVRVKLYTVPGQIHYEVTRRQVLGGADGVVLVMDSSPDAAKNNLWAGDNMRSNLKGNGFDPDTFPTVLQWNKRDLKNARPVAEMQAELNKRGLPAFEAVATTGVGVIETFVAVLKEAVRKAYAKSGRAGANPAALDQVVEKALEKAKARVTGAPLPAPPSNPVDDHHRMDMGAYQEQWADRGRDRKIVDQETLLAEAVQSGMELAEKLDGLRNVHGVSELRGRMMEALGRAIHRLADPAGAPVPDGLVADLAGSCGRKRASLLFFKGGEKVMEEREVVPAGIDPLNGLIAPSLGSAAFRLCQGTTSRSIEDLASEVFFDSIPPGGADLTAAWIVPVGCDGMGFGAVVVYAAVGEPEIGTIEREYWSTAATLLGLSLHWRALRRKVAQPEPSSVGASGR